MMRFVFIFIWLITKVETKPPEIKAISYDRFGSKAFLFYEKSNLTIKCYCGDEAGLCKDDETTIKGGGKDFLVERSSYSIPVISDAHTHYYCESNGLPSNHLLLQILCDYDSDSCNKGCSSVATNTKLWLFCLKGKKECETMDKDSCKEKDFGYFACLDDGNSEESLCKAFAKTKNVNVMVSDEGFCEKGQLPIKVTMSNRQVYVGSVKKFNETITIQVQKSFAEKLVCVERFGIGKEGRPIERPISISETAFTLSSEGTNSYVSQLFCEAKSSVVFAYFYAYNYRINSKISITKTHRKPNGGITSAVMEQDFVCEFESPPKDKKFHPTIVATLNGKLIIHEKNDTKLTFTDKRFGKYKCTGSIKFIHCNPYYIATESSSSDELDFNITYTTSTSTSTSELNTVQEKSTENNMNLVIIVASAVGGVAFLVIVGLLIWCGLFRKRRVHKNEARNDSWQKKRVSEDSHDSQVTLMGDNQDSGTPSKESRNKPKDKRKQQKPRSHRESRSLTRSPSNQSAAPPNRSELPSYLKEPVNKPGRHSSAPAVLEKETDRKVPLISLPPLSPSFVIEQEEEEIRKKKLKQKENVAEKKIKQK